MKYAKRALSSALLILLLTGCANTVRPTVVQSSQASWDAGEQTSGIIGAEMLNGKKSFHVTPHFVDRYNALIEKYAERFFPPLLRNAGISHDEQTATHLEGKDYPSDYHIDAEHMAKFLDMNRWRKQGK